jgi:hypothetical protein
MHVLQKWRLVDFKEVFSAQDLADFEKVSSAIGVRGTMTGSRGARDQIFKSHF